MSTSNPFSIREIAARKNSWRELLEETGGEPVEKVDLAGLQLLLAASAYGLPARLERFGNSNLQKLAAAAGAPDSFLTDIEKAGTS